MSGREVKEWIGAKPDTAIPPRVKLRVFDRQEGRCAHCQNKLGVAGSRVEYDHALALTNGGENRETNLQALCQPCHGAKTKGDVAEKSRVARKKRKHLGIERKKSAFPGSKNSKWKAKIGGGWVRRDEE